MNEQAKTLRGRIEQLAKGWSGYPFRGDANSYAQGVSYATRGCGQSLREVLKNYPDTAPPEIPEGWEECSRDEADGLIFNGHVYERGQAQEGKLTWTRDKQIDKVCYNGYAQCNCFWLRDAEFSGYNPIYIRRIPAPKTVVVEVSELEKVANYMDEESRADKSRREIFAHIADRLRELAKGEGVEK